MFPWRCIACGLPIDELGNVGCRSCSRQNTGMHDLVHRETEIRSMSVSLVLLECLHSMTQKTQARRSFYEA